MRSNANHHEPTLDFGLPAAYADIALRLALPGSLQFGIPESLRGSLRLGQRVMVPLRGGRDVGYVVGLSSEPKVRGIRPIERVLDPEPHLPPDLLELMLWIAHHYLSPIGMVLRAAVPQAVHYEGTNKAVARERQILTAAVTIPADEAEALLPDLARRAPAQAEALAGLCRAQGKPIPASSFNRAALEGLQKKGLVTLGSTGSRRGILPPPETSVEPAPLTPAQTAVFSRILPALAGGAKPLLVQGVTGSGKTELYLRAIRALPPDRQALLLVPEVSLTIQLIRHLRERLPFPIAVWHHQLSDGEKFDLWRAIRRGEVRTVVGTRSALFAPLPRLGLIVVDEEQEASFKQEETPCYHARDAAIVRAANCGAAVILGSATPSLESRHLAEEGVFTLLRLPERYTGLPLPQVEILDLRNFAAPGRRSIGARGEEPRLIAPPLLEAARETLERGDQVLFFLNRRGFAPHTQCRACGAGISCPNCRVSLVFHAPEQAHLCHYCGYRAEAPDTCPACGAAGTAPLRLGHPAPGAGDPQGLPGTRGAAPRPRHRLAQGRRRAGGRRFRKRPRRHPRRDAAGRQGAALPAADPRRGDLPRPDAEPPGLPGRRAGLLARRAGRGPGRARPAGRARARADLAARPLRARGGAHPRLRFLLRQGDRVPPRAGLPAVLRSRRAAARRRQPGPPRRGRRRNRRPAAGTARRRGGRPAPATSWGRSPRRWRRSATAGAR